MKLGTRLKNVLPFLAGPQPPQPPLLGAYQQIVEADTERGHELTINEIQQLTGWDSVQMATAAPGLGRARALWAHYRQELAGYERKLAKREERLARKQARRDRSSARPKEGPVSSTPGEDRNVISTQAETLEEIITPRGRSFSDLTADELSARRRAILANTPFDLPVHRKFTNAVKEIWRVIGPPTFVVFTVWEVYYFMNHFLQTHSIFDVVLLWGISLIIEIPFMVATYDQSERRERAAECKARGEPNTIPGKISSLVFWTLLALVNVAGQIAFLAFVTRAGYSLSSPSAVGLWGFILLRVTGVIIGDCYTAFHLLPTEASIDRVLRGQQAQMEGEERLADSDAKRLRSSAEVDRSIRQIELSVKRDEREATFMEEWQKMNMRQTLERQRHFMDLESQQLLQLGRPDEGERRDQQDDL